MKTLWLQLPDGRRAEVTWHAMDRYAERFRPALEGDRLAIVADMQRIVDLLGIVATHPPRWKHVTGEDPHRYLPGGWVHCEDVALVLANDAGVKVVTVLIKGDLSPEVREGRNLRAAVRRGRRRARRKKRSKIERRERRDAQGRNAGKGWT